MNKTKYIIVDNGLTEVIIAFSEFLQHRDFLSAFNNIVSAGFIQLQDDGTFRCYGKSVSLGCPSREEDSEIANRQLLS